MQYASQLGTAKVQRRRDGNRTAVRSDTRGCATHLTRKAGYTKTTAQTGAVTLNLVDPNP